MLSKLNGWQRIGVVLTGFWLLLVFSIGFIDYLNLETGRGPFLRTTPGNEVLIQKGTEGHCTQNDAGHYDPETEDPFCSMGDPAGSRIHHGYIEGTPDITRKLPDKHAFQFGGMLVTAFAPPAVVWLLLWAALVIIRWVAVGFRRK